MCNSTLNPVYKGLLLLVLAVFSLSAASAQNETVTFPSEKMPAGKVIDEIEKQTKFSFIYSSSILDPASDVALDACEMSLRSAMDKVTDGRDLEYSFRNNYIVIGRKAPAAPSPVSRTGDRYKRNSANAIDGFYGSKEIRPAEVRIDTVVTPGQPLAYPDPYSDYTPLQAYDLLPGRRPSVALKTNLLYGAATFTPNLAVEFGVGDRSTVEIGGGYNWQGRNKTASPDHRQRLHLTLRPEYRYWLCERFNGHYFGVHGTYFKYNVSGYKVPLLFDKDKRYEGYAYGAGLTYGYHWAFARRWGADFNLGVGYMRMKHDEFSCAKCDIEGVSKTKNYFGPTRAGISLVFIIR